MHRRRAMMQADVQIYATNLANKSTPLTQM
jgi:hypothetical protein